MPPAATFFIRLVSNLKVGPVGKLACVTRAGGFRYKPAGIPCPVFKQKSFTTHKVFSVL